MVSRLKVVKSRPASLRRPDLVQFTGLVRLVVFSHNVTIIDSFYRPTDVDGIYYVEPRQKPKPKELLRQS